MQVKVIEGNGQRLDGGAMFGNAPKALWAKWITPDENNCIPLATRSLLVQTSQGKNILFDAGIGAYLEPKLKQRFGVLEEEHVLLQNLEKEGLTHQNIDAVVLSHLHFDHAGGLLSRYGEGEIKLLFPNAKFYVGKKHWERALHPHPREKASFIPLLHDLLEKSERLCLVSDSKHPDLPEISFHFSDGHTVGLMVSEIQTDKGTLFFLSDLAPGVPWVHIPITMGYDRYPELVVNEKIALFRRVIDLEATVCFVHDPKVSMGKLLCNEKGKYSVSPL